ncbi:MAG: hypothetical protein WAW36_11760 [Methylovulum miyakonense]|uniref:hypothetical protein n=1 Tax=Methylovulum miyakonense TaxID=645578 RepID=UPI003BB67703
MMAKIISFGLLMFFFSSPMARLRNDVSEQDILNSVAKETDTIFVGRVLRQMEIRDGLVYDSGESMSLAVLELEVLETYRGKQTNDEKQIVCTWFGGYGEYYFDPSAGLGREYLIFGIQVGSIVQLPEIFRYIRGVPKDKSAIYKALKLKIKKTKDKSNILATFYDSKVIRNACNEPIV